jgi:hypothetical protein
MQEDVFLIETFLLQDDLWTFNSKEMLDFFVKASFLISSTMLTLES